MRGVGTRSNTQQLPDFIGLVGIVLAGIIQISMTSGPFTFWNVMTGIPLLLLLYVYRPSTNGIIRLIITMATIWGLLLILTSGVILQALYRVVFEHQPLLPLRYLYPLTPLTPIPIGKHQISIT